MFYVISVIGIIAALVVALSLSLKADKTCHDE